MKKYLVAFLKIILFVLAVLLVAEMLIRVSSRINSKPDNAYMANYNASIFALIHPLWLRTSDNTDPFLPPFTVYADTGYDDPQRLKHIFDTTRLEPSHAWTSYDFLQGVQNASSTSYSITSNSLGFRGEEYTKAKSKGTYRVIMPDRTGGERECVD